MYLLGAAVLAAISWLGWRGLQKRDPRLGKAFWRTSLAVLVGYVLFVLVGGFVTRLMVGFTESALAELLLVLFFGVWVLYGGLWLIRLLPSTRPRAGWIGNRFLDVLGVVGIVGLAVLARLV